MASKYSRQHYEDIAQTLHDSIVWEDAYPQTVERMAERFVDLFSEDNPRFNADKFRDAVRDGVKNYYARR